MKNRVAAAAPQAAFGLLFLLSSLPSIVRWVQTAPDASLADALLPASLAIALWSVLAALAGRLRLWLALLALAALLGPWEAFYVSQFHLTSGPHLYGVIADTDWAETASWLGPWAWPLALGVVAQPAAIVLMARSLWRVDWRWRHRSRGWVLAGGVALAALIGAGEAWMVEADEILTAAQGPEGLSYLQHSLEASHDGARSTLETSFPWGLPQRFARFAEHRQALATHMSVVRLFDFQPRWETLTPAQRVVHVVVIGETSRADRWSLFGAARDTTPHLTQRHERGELIAFNDAASPASATREAVPLMLTRRPAGALLMHLPEPSLVTAFRQAGFRTYWLSTQGAAGRHETPVSVLAREAHEQQFINNADYSAHGAQDEELLPQLAAVLARPEPRQFIVLHTLGSHLHYAHRYPLGFAHFQPALTPDEKADIWRRERVEAMRNAYDNSLRYTDHVLDQAIAQLARTGAIATLTYASDHGETLFDGQCPRAGHGFSAIANYHVPMFIWASSDWQTWRPADWLRLTQRQQEPVSTLAMFSTVLYLAGLGIAQPTGYPSLSAPTWTPTARPVTHFGDYDRDIRTRGCDAPRAAASR